MPNACPGCASPLVAFELEGIELDHCVSCGGTWLDPGELEQIALLAEGTERGAFAKRVEGRRGVSGKSTRRCPRCGKGLEGLMVEHGDRELKLDRCPRGDGLWLDRGELQTLLGGPGSPAEGPVSRFLCELFQFELNRRTKGA